MHVEMEGLKKDGLEMDEGKQNMSQSTRPRQSRVPLHGIRILTIACTCAYNLYIYNIPSEQPPWYLDDAWLVPCALLNCRSRA